MKYHDMPEFTTGLTDVFMGMVGLFFFILLLRQFTDLDRVGILWSWMFAALGFGGLLGGVVHCIDFSPATDRLIWMPIFLCLGTALAMTLSAAVIAHGGMHIYKTTLILSTLLCMCLAVSMMLLPKTARWNLAAAVGCAIIAAVLFCYIRLTFINHAYGWFLLGIAVLLAGALPWVIRYYTFTVGGMLFDADSVCHISIALALPEFYQGCRKTAVSHP